MVFEIIWAQEWKTVGDGVGEMLGVSDIVGDSEMVGFDVGV